MANGRSILIIGSRLSARVRCWWNTPAPNLPLAPNYRPRQVCGGPGLGKNDIWFPEDLAGEEHLSSYPPQEVAKKTLDQYRTLVQNPVIVGSAPVQLALENRSRRELLIVNVGTSAILIAFGFSPTVINYTLPLQACALANDGTGGIIVDAEWKGTVWAILAANQAGNGSLLFTEVPE